MEPEYGVLPCADLLEPAIEIAQDGAPVTGYLAASLSTRLGRQVTAGLPHFRTDGGQSLQEGDLLVQVELAESMRQIANDPDTVYTGTLSDELLQIPGLDQETFGSYQVQVSPPAEGPIGDYIMLSGAPALPGAAIIQMTQIAETASLTSHRRGSTGARPSGVSHCSIPISVVVAIDASSQQSFSSTAWGPGARASVMLGQEGQQDPREPLRVG